MFNTQLIWLTHMPQDFGIAKDDSGKPSFEHIQLITDTKSDHFTSSAYQACAATGIIQRPEIEEANGY
jgi:hypothetical protein